MLLARIRTSTPDLVLDLKRDLRAAGYLVEILSPEDKSTWTADLALRVEPRKCSARDTGEIARTIHVECGTDQQSYSSLREVIERDRITRNPAKQDHPASNVPRATFHSGLLTFFRAIARWIDRTEDEHSAATALALTILVAVLTIVLSMHHQLTTASSGAAPESFTQQGDSAKVARKLSALAAVRDDMDSSGRTEMGKASRSNPAMAEEDREVIVRHFTPAVSHKTKISKTVKKFSDLD